MERHTIRLITSEYRGDGIQVNLMSDLLDELAGGCRVREKLSVSKQQAAQKFYMRKFNLNKQNEVEGKEQYQVKISNRFPALENSDYDVEQHKTWFDDGCSKLLHQTKHAKLQWLQDPSQINGDNLNNVKM
jgi:hypothetical protein